MQTTDVPSGLGAMCEARLANWYVRVVRTRVAPPRYVTLAPVCERRSLLTPAGSSHATTRTHRCASYCGRTDLVASARLRRCEPIPTVPRAASEKNASGRWCSRKRPPSENTALRKEWAACTSMYMNDAPAEAQGATQAADRYINATSALAGACIAADASALRGARMRLAETVRTVASTKLVAACLVRDAGSYLERNLLAMLEMGRAFAAFRLLYLENDSADDGTRDILRRLERTSQPPGTVRGLMLNNAANATSFALCPRSQARRNCAARLSLLSHLRQRLLELARTVLREDAFDALLLFDADFVSFSKAAYLRSLALGKLMGASAIFALSTYKATPSGKLMPYDRGILPTAFSAPKALEAIQQSPARCALGKMTLAHTAWPASIAGTPAVRHTTCGAAPCRAAVPSAVDLSVVCAHAHIRPTRLVLTSVLSTRMLLSARSEGALGLWVFWDVLSAADARRQLHGHRPAIYQATRQESVDRACALQHGDRRGAGPHTPTPARP